MEIWNNIFLQYNKMEDGTFEELEQVERIVNEAIGKKIDVILEEKTPQGQSASFLISMGTR